MKAIGKLIGRFGIKGMAMLILLAGSALTAGNWRHQPAMPWMAPIESEQEEGESPSDEAEHRNAREEWFRFQRAYPFDSIPAEGRLKAWKTRPREQYRVQADTPTWRSIGPKPISAAFLNNWGFTTGRITALAISPIDPQLILFGGSVGGIWRSTDGGANFVPVTDNQVDLSVNSIAFAPSNPAIVYAGMGADFLGTGVLKSTDSGQTWVRINNSSLPSPGYIFKISVNAVNPNIVYACQFAFKAANGNVFSSGFFLSTDGGINWRRTLIGLPVDLALDPGNPQKLLLSMLRVDERSLPPGIYRSTDGGTTWANVYTGPFLLTNGINIRLSAAPATPNMFYAYAFGTINGEANLRVLVSTDDGVSWIERAGNGMKKTIWDYMMVDPSNSNIVYIGVEDIYKSTDGGDNFVNMTNNYTSNGNGYNFTPNKANSHADEHDLAFVPGNSNSFFIGCDGGLYKTTDGGTTFKSLNEGLTLTESNSIAINPINPAISYSGTQDNSTIKRIDGGLLWKEPITGDGGNVVINPLDPSMVFMTYIYGTVWRFVKDGTQFDKTVGSNALFGEPDGQQRINFYAAFTGNGVDSTLYFGTYRLLISKDLGNSWVAPAGELDLTKGRTPSGSDAISTIGVSRSNTNVIYTGSDLGRAMRTTDAGLTWTDVSNGLPDRFIKSITVDKANPAIAYLTVSGYASGHVFKTTNSGASWQDVSGNLPDIPTNALLIDDKDPLIIYVGTDIGIFRSTVGGTTWQSFNDGMPPVVVTAFASHPSGIIQAATYGRGIYELNPNAAPGDFSLGVDNSAPTVSQGASTTFNINAQSADGFNQPIALTATVTPADPSVTVSFSASTLTVGGSVAVTVKTTVGTPQGAYTVRVVGTSSSLIHSATVNLTVTEPQLSIASVVFKAPKKMTILGVRFGGAPRVLINGVDRSGFITSVADTEIHLKGKIKKLGLQPGDNTIQVIDQQGRASNIVTLQI